MLRSKNKKFAISFRVGKSEHAGGKSEHNEL